MNLKRRDFIKIIVRGGIALIANPWIIKRVSAEKEIEGPLPWVEQGGLIRPPGALPEREFRSKCTGCGLCVNVCHVMKYDAIAVAGLRDIKNLGTPFIKDMRDFPCGLCMECPKRCPTGALRPIDKEEVRMGMALIDLGLCFGWNGDVCLSCSKACPLGAKVFEFYNSEWGNQPYINENCVGCGLCVKYCPLGGSAVKVIRREKYSEIKEKYIKEFRELLSISREERYNIIYGKNLPEIMARGKIHEREYR